MSAYSILVLDAAGLVEGELEMEFDTDQEAVDALFASESPFSCELWRGAILLGLFPAARPLQFFTLIDPAR